jgi:hypothetical protein
MSRISDGRHFIIMSLHHTIWAGARILFRDYISHDYIDTRLDMSRRHRYQFAFLSCSIVTFSFRWGQMVERRSLGTRLTLAGKRGLESSNKQPEGLLSFYMTCLTMSCLQM